MAMLISPSLRGLPWVSEMMTATVFPVCFFISCLICLADLSGSFGSKATVLSPGTLLLSTPELAQMNPCFVSVIRLLLRMRMMFSASLRTISTAAGSLSLFLAIALANSEGSMVLRSMVLPSERETITWVTITMSSFWIGVFCFSAALQINSAMLAPFPIIGSPVMGIIWMEFMKRSFCCGELISMMFYHCFCFSQIVGCVYVEEGCEFWV